MSMDVSRHGFEKPSSVQGCIHKVNCRQAREGALGYKVNCRQAREGALGYKVNCVSKTR